MRRVVITGMGGLSPIGVTWSEVEGQLKSGRNGVRYMSEWDDIEGLNTRLGAAVPAFDLPAHYDRKRTRSMGRVGLLATRASEIALEDAGLLEDPVLTSGRTGVAFGSSSGSPPALSDLARILINKSTDSVKANSYIQIMPHMTAVNVSVFFGIRGRLIPTSTACTSGSLAIGLAYEAIREGRQTVMVAGGADELCPSQATVFDTLFATSTRNDEPDRTPRPFDEARDGLVVGEGGGAMVLEDLEHARARGATIHAEVVGFGTNTDGQHVTQPSQDTMTAAIRSAVEDSGLPAEVIGYVNAHGTATDVGDIAESRATLEALGSAVPISSLKSYIGHTLGACGSLEAWMTIEMLKQSWFAPTLNLQKVDERCAELDYVSGAGRYLDPEYVMSNNFAFGGVNTSLILRRWA
ncbi:beta-ketoacyl-ACP synthase [Pelagibius marinus]|uniref:beta-ketoacyl-ACP synthase n=1 Tax=Pelagibius marinus TaxID=2762760 RepID=UPI001D0377FB|nr:beta-ketoacyl-ACP synthase [Pelagibius marinus]